MCGVKSNSPIKINRQQIYGLYIQFQCVLGKLLINNYICAVQRCLESVYAIAVLQSNYLISIFRKNRGISFLDIKTCSSSEERRGFWGTKLLFLKKKIGLFHLCYISILVGSRSTQLHQKFCSHYFQCKPGCLKVYSNKKLFSQDFQPSFDSLRDCYWSTVHSRFYYLGVRRWFLMR